MEEYRLSQLFQLKQKDFTFFTDSTLPQFHTLFYDDTVSWYSVMVLHPFCESPNAFTRHATTAGRRTRVVFTIKTSKVENCGLWEGFPKRTAEQWCWWGSVLEEDYKCKSYSALHPTWTFNVSFTEGSKQIKTLGATKLTDLKITSQFWVTWLFWGWHIYLWF